MGFSVEIGESYTITVVLKNFCFKGLFKNINQKEETYGRSYSRTNCQTVIHLSE